MDWKGTGTFEKYKSITSDKYASHILPKDFSGQWIRVITDKTCNASVSFQFSDDTYRKAEEGKELFQQLADHNDEIIQSLCFFPMLKTVTFPFLAQMGKPMILIMYPSHTNH